MQGRLIPRLSYPRFHERVAKQRFAVIAVARGPAKLDPGMVTWFDHKWPGDFSFGTLDMSRTPPPGFVDRCFQTTMGRLRMGPKGPPSGTYLFEYGVVIGFHSGVVGTSPIHDDLAAFVRPKARLGNPDTLVAVTRYLSELTDRKVRGRAE